MSLDCTPGSSSDDEIYFGKITLKEIKKRLFWHNQPQLCTASATNSPKKCETHNSSLKIIKTHSQPNLLTEKDKENQNLEDVNMDWQIGEDDSFIKMETMVEKLCVSPTLANLKKTEELNNTLEVIEYILNNPPNNEDKTDNVADGKPENLKPVVKADTGSVKEFNLHNLKKIPSQETRIDGKISSESPKYTPMKIEKKEIGYKTPVDTKSIFKTPAQSISVIKPSSSLKKTSSKSNAYQHISSPVASYIKNCPIVPLVKDVHPKKPLHSLSHIPKLKTHGPVFSSNKENVNLPSVAYKSAKNMKVIDLSDEQRLPQSPWAKKLTPSLQRPLVVKHDHRELNFAKKKLLPQQEESIADLSDHQAEVSVCIQKSAFKTHNKKA